MFTKSLSCKGSLSFCLLVTGFLMMTIPACAESTLSLTADDRLSNRPADLWKYYMHGCVDHFATPIDIHSLADSTITTTDAVIDNPYKQHTGKAVFVAGKTVDHIVLPNPLPIDIKPNQKLRLYFWIKGINAGMREDIWKAPNVTLILKDAKGKTIKADGTRLHTVGDFDWHCYYLDTHIHKRTEKIYLKLTNTVRGSAGFTALGYEWVNKANDFSTNDKQDPVTGSTAQNVYHDELPSHVQSARGSRYPWHFLKGAKAIPVMVGQQYDIVSQAGLKHYFQDHPHTLQPYHRHHAIMYLPGMYYKGSVNKAENGQTIWPSPYDEWINDFAQLLLEEQDPKTGYWRTTHGLNMGLTFHYANMLFRYYSPARSDRPLRTNGSMHIGLKYIPYANNIIDSTLAMQSHTEDGKLAAWNRSAYRYTTEPDKDDHKCDFGTTWDAIYLLRIAALNPEVDVARKAKVYDAIKASHAYLLKHNIQADGTWKLKDSDKHPTRSSYMYGIIEDTHWLEWRIDPSITSPTVTLTGQTLTAKFTDPQHNSVRLFAVPKDFDPAKLDETHMFGIIQKSGKLASNMDPFVGMTFIRKAGNAMWGINNDMPAEDHWRYQRYTYWKMRKLSDDLIVTDDNHPITLPATASGENIAIYATAVNWYGEQSPPVLITKH